MLVNERRQTRHVLVTNAEPLRPQLVERRLKQPAILLDQRAPKGEERERQAMCPVRVAGGRELAEPGVELEGAGRGGGPPLPPPPAPPPTGTRAG
ncbi:hypothetical protein WCLP8_4810002 [uncultured Gammaproteobacteria bacterium]